MYTSTGMRGFSEQGPQDWDFAIGSVTGYRWWYWHVPPKLAGYRDEEWANGPDSYSYLVGAYKGEWEPGRIEAQCKSHGTGLSYSFKAELEYEHIVPANRCGCGFWAYWDQGLKAEEILYNAAKQPNIVREYYLNKTPMVKVPVLGVVEGSGRTIIGTKGFRSQYAKIKALCIPEEGKEMLRYDVKADPVYRARPDLATISDDPSWIYNFDRASAIEIVRRFVEAESVLQELYPGVKICPDRESMMLQFPKDNNYGGK